MKKERFGQQLTPENANRLLVGEYKMKPVQTIKSGDTIVQFGHKIKVLEVIPKQNNKFDIVVEGKEKERLVWENLDGATMSFSILIPEKPSSSDT